MASGIASGGVAGGERNGYPRGGNYGDGSVTAGAGSRPPDVANMQSPWW